MLENETSKQKVHRIVLLALQILAAKACVTSAAISWSEHLVSFCRSTVWYVSDRLGSRCSIFKPFCNTMIFLKVFYVFVHGFLFAFQHAQSYSSTLSTFLHHVYVFLGVIQHDLHIILILLPLQCISGLQCSALRLNSSKALQHSSSTCRWPSRYRAMYLHMSGTNYRRRTLTLPFSHPASLNLEIFWVEWDLLWLKYD